MREKILVVMVAIPIMVITLSSSALYFRVKSWDISSKMYSKVYADGLKEFKGGG